MRSPRKGCPSISRIWSQSLQQRLAAELGEALDRRHKSRRKLLKIAEASLDEMVAVPAWWKSG